MSDVFLLTFTCKGSWLASQAGRYKEPPFRLNLRTGRTVVDAMLAAAGRRRWRVYGIHALPDRVSAVVEIGADPGQAIRRFKAEASRRLAAEGSRRARRWNRVGSWRLLDREAIRGAVRQMVDGQGPPMVVFENPGRGARASPPGVVREVERGYLASGGGAWGVGG